MDEYKVPYDKIEEGIRPLVRTLNEAGIKTFASCEGHSETQLPWINCEVSDDYTEKDIVTVLVDNWVGGFSLSKVWYINNTTNPLNYTPEFHHWSIYFWKLLDET